MTPLSNNFSDHYQFVEMMEVNRMFGADHFVFYNYQIGRQLHPYLEYYTENGIADILPWNLPVKVDPYLGIAYNIPEIHYFGQLVALNDCLYRNMFTSRFLVFTDLDEIIVPRHDATWNNMLERVTTKESDVTRGAWMFQNTFFRSEWDSDQNAAALAKNLRLTTILKTRREEYIYPAYMRSKVIVKPQLVNMMGTHFVHVFLNEYNTNTFEVDPSDGLLHHYRVGFDDHEHDEFVLDTYMQKYEDKILDRVQTVRNSINLSLKFQHYNMKNK
jgi:hypothetical protein